MKRIAAIISLLFSLFVTQNLKSQTADIILTNGKIFTADDTRLYVQALAVKENKIIATGNNTDILKLAGRSTKRIDLGGKIVVPGFNDAHDHPAWFAPIGKSYSYNDLNPAGLDKHSVLDSIARLLKLAKPGEWIYGLIGNTVFFDNSMRPSLDSLAPVNPVSLQVWWGHGIVANKKALDAAGISDANADPVGGWYIRTVDNKINSLQQNAQAPLWIARNKFDEAGLIKGLRSFSEEQLAVGITSVQFMGTGFDGPLAEKIFKAADIQQRIRVIAWPRSTTGGRQLKDWNVNNVHPSPLTTVSGIKYVIDGTPLEGNALRTTAYDKEGKWYGRLNYPIDTMYQLLKEALNSDRQLMMHITADSSFKIVLSLMKELGTPAQWRAKRVRIEHNTVGSLSDEQKRSLREMNVLMMHTPKYGMASPLRSEIESGVIVGIAPDGTTNPFVDIMMVAGMQSDPAENITVEQAVIAYTKNNAYAEFKEHTKGTLVKGMLADFVVLSQDIFTIPIQQLPATTSLLTIVNGKIVHHRSDRLVIK